MGKKITDGVIVLCSAALAVYTAVWQDGAWKWPLFLILMIVALLALNDLIDRFVPRNKEKKYGLEDDMDGAVRELILLDENEKPVKSWDMAGKVAMLIGRDNSEEPVDVDLEECEYSSLIDYQHAVLNYCMDSWYIEDLNSHNGIRIRKVTDGVCYRVMKNRPCRLMPGDMIYIANTKLLIT